MSGPRWHQQAAAAALALWACGVLLFEALALAGLGATLLLWASSLRRAPPDLREAALRWWPLWAFVAWTVGVGLLTGGARPTGVARTLDWLGVPLAAWAFLQLDGRGRRVVAGAAFTVLALSSLAAGLQNHGVWPPPETFDPVRWTRIPFHRVYEPATVEGRFMGGGLSFHRLKYSHVGGLAVLFAALVALHTRGRERLLAAAAALTGAVAITLFTYARSATAALLASLALLAVLHAGSWRRAAAALAAMVALAAAVLALHSGIRDRFASALTTSGAGDRDQILATGGRAFAKSPWVGVGAGAFSPARFADERTPRHVIENPGKAHNQLFSIAIETGVIGLSLFLVMLASLLRRAWKARERAAAVILAYFLLLGLAHDPLFQAEFSLALVLALGICAALGARGATAAAPAASTPAAGTGSPS